MKPTELEKLVKFREALVKVYVGAGKGGKDKIWAAAEVIAEMKRLIEHFDNMFKDNLQ
ncbi:MAG: hypothetical protein AABY22_31765 [Nanoarchaeota archaeon]